MSDTRGPQRGDIRGLSPRLLRLWRGSQRALHDTRERLVALLILVVVALVAGLTLGHNVGRLEDLPGLLLMVPAAIALRGNIFGALGSRLGTAIHAGTFRLSLRPSSVVGENLLASFVLTLASSVALAVLAKGAAVGFGVAGSISLADFIVVSVVGGLLASVAVVITALLLTSGSVRFGWDPDNVTAPLVTAVGDVATVPALVIAAELVGRRSTSATISMSALVLVAIATVSTFRSGRAGLRTIVHESTPVLLVGIVLDLVAGATVERQLASFARFPSLLVLLPAFLAVAGALGGTLSSRLGSQFHLGTIGPAPVPEPRARQEIYVTMALALPVFAVCGALAHTFAVVGDLTSPGVGWSIGASMLGGAAATVLASAVAYYSTIGSVRAGLDPDSYGIPLVTSTLDLVGAFTLIVAIEVLGFV